MKESKIRANKLSSRKNPGPGRPLSGSVGHYNSYNSAYRYTGSGDRGDEMNEQEAAALSLEIYTGTVVGNNRYLRKQLLDFRNKRDDYLFTYFYPMMKPFLQENVCDTSM